MITALVLDATGTNEPHLPAGTRWVAGYDTGSQGIAWTAQQYAAHPGAIHIDQDPHASDYTADFLDVEALAGTIAEAPNWYRNAVAMRATGKRPGQRPPGFYASQSVITPLANQLTGAGILHGPHLWIAHWGIGQAQATADVTETGPFPVSGWQFTNLGSWDVSVFALDYLQPQPVPVPVPQPGWALVAESDLRTASNLVSAALAAIQHNAR